MTHAMQQASRVQRILFFVQPPPPLCGAFLGWAARAARSDAFWRWALFMSDRAQYAADRMRPRAVRVGVHNRPVGLSTDRKSVV